MVDRKKQFGEFSLKKQRKNKIIFCVLPSFGSAVRICDLYKNFQTRRILNRYIVPSLPIQDIDLGQLELGFSIGKKK